MELWNPLSPCASWVPKPCIGSLKPRYSPFPALSMNTLGWKLGNGSLKKNIGPRRSSTSASGWKHPYKISGSPVTTIYWSPLLTPHIHHTHTPSGQLLVIYSWTWSDSPRVTSFLRKVTKWRGEDEETKFLKEKKKMTQRNRNSARAKNKINFNIHREIRC
jgi:hypothetical protein